MAGCSLCSARTSFPSSSATQRPSSARRIPTGRRCTTRRSDSLSETRLLQSGDDLFAVLRIAEQRAEILQIEEGREAARLAGGARRLLALAIVGISGSQDGVDERVGVIARHRPLERADGIGTAPRQEIAGSEAEQVLA